jgi:hypothetical protein
MKHFPPSKVAEALPSGDHKAALSIMGAPIGLDRVGLREARLAAEVAGSTNRSLRTMIFREVR